MPKNSGFITLGRIDLHVALLWIFGNGLIWNGGGNDDVDVDAKRKFSLSAWEI